jgi:hypothetical protein
MGGYVVLRPYLASVGWQGANPGRRAAFLRRLFGPSPIGWLWCGGPSEKPADESILGASAWFRADKWSARRCTVRATSYSEGSTGYDSNLPQMRARQDAAH